MIENLLQNLSRTKVSDVQIHRIGFCPAAPVSARETLASSPPKPSNDLHRMTTVSMLTRTPFLGLINGEFQTAKLIPCRRSTSLASKSLRVSRATLASDDFGSKRLVDVVRRLPRIANSYFRSPFRRALFGGISILLGFYVAQTISLSFGALGVNDVIAAAMCVLFTEYITRFTRTRKSVSFSVALVNTFKMGFTYGLFIDAFKLAS